MREIILLLTALCLCLAQVGCGSSGGGGSNPNGGGSGSGGSSVISGTASKGIIVNGTVKLYAINPDGTRGGLLATTTTDSSGRYSQALSGYSGPVLAVAYGNYTDEATGAAVTLDESHALRAALPATSGTVPLAITALTDLAVRKAGTLTPAAISQANAEVSSIFKVDITGCSPVDASASAMGAAGVTAVQRDYTLVLAAVSQLAGTMTGSGAEKVEQALGALDQAISSNAMTPAMAENFSTAVSSYLDSHAAINAVITNNGGSAAIGAGRRTATITISLSGATDVYGAQFSLVLPAGVTVPSQPDGSPNSGVIGMTSSTAGSFFAGKFTPASATSNATLTIALGMLSSIANGPFLIINADVADGTATLTKDSFSIPEPYFGSAMTAALTVTDVTLR